jgi:surface polysaccharide O-acyltransferase-like enzyme
MRRPPTVRFSALLALAGFALIVLPTALVWLKTGAMEQRFLEGMSVGVCLLAAGLFSLLYLAGERLRTGRLRAAAERISRASFCIFLVHAVWLDVFSRHGLTSAAFAPLVSIPLLALGNGVLSFLCWWILSKIPFVNRWLI